MREITRSLKALANERRLKTLVLLQERAPRSVGEIARALHLSVKSTSKHLRILAAADMVSSRQIGLKILYETRHNPLVEIMRHLIE